MSEHTMLRFPFYDQQILIHGSNQDGGIDMPLDWPKDKDYIYSDNVIMIDPTNIIDMDIDYVEIEKGESIPGGGAKLLVKHRIDTTKHKLYIGDQVQEQYWLESVEKEGADIAVYYRQLGDNVLRFTVQIS